MSTRLVRLVRHGTAGVRGTWPGSDLDRPLDGRGEAQAAALVELLADGATALWSSPTERCRATLAPLAARTGLPVLDATELAEGVRAGVTLRWLSSREDGAVCCTHGEVLEELLAPLVDEGVADEDTPRPKGGWWDLTLVDGVPRSVTAHAPPA